MTTATIFSQVLDRIDAILQAALAGQAVVYRERADAFCIEETPSVNVLPANGSTEVFGNDTDRDRIHFDLKIYVRDEPPTPAAEAIHQLAHQALTRDAQLQLLVAGLRREDTSFDPQAADTTSLIKTVRYRAQYLTPNTTL